MHRVLYAQAIDAYVDEHADDLVELVRDLVRFDTTSVDLSPGSEHTENEEAALQAYAAERLQAAGAEVDQWEPDAELFAGHPMMPPWHHWRNRPLTVGVFRGGGGGRWLLVNGHIDVVSAGDETRWTSPPFAADVRDGRIYGRGACDMKGGVGAALFALEALRACGVGLAGDVIFEVVPDEETCAMGTIAAIERGYRADAGLVPEPTRNDLWVATRGLLHGTLTVPGRSAHAEMNQPPWEEGGGVNSIQKTMLLLQALNGLSAEWAEREDKRHPLLGTPAVHPTIVRGGSFISNVPEQCELALNTTYLPGNADAEGYGTVPRGEIERTVADAAAADGWLAANPPAWSWYTDYPPSEIDPATPIVAAAREAGRELGLDVRPVGIDTTYDGALLTLFADTPSPAFGPGDLARAHAPDEWIGIDELILGTKLYARTIAAWCGAEGGM
ncbi:MAG TPA: ArgE/DapE family deacylase [Gaiellaceae bacterium]|nr:ArgE/DapE family deacylase [Gaiellaceae bacterium]